MDSPVEAQAVHFFREAIRSITQIEYNVILQRTPCPNDPRRLQVIF
jgi:hypothetical protein